MKSMAHHFSDKLNSLINKTVEVIPLVEITEQECDLLFGKLAVFVKHLSVEKDRRSQQPAMSLEELREFGSFRHLCFCFFVFFFVFCFFSFFRLFLEKNLKESPHRKSVVSK